MILTGTNILVLLGAILVGGWVIVHANQHRSTMFVIARFTEENNKEQEQEDDYKMNGKVYFSRQYHSISSLIIDIFAM